MWPISVPLISLIHAIVKLLPNMLLMRPFYIVFLLIELLCRRDSITLPCKKAPFLSVYAGNAITKDQSHTRQERPNKEANMMIKSI